MPRPRPPARAPLPNASQWCPTAVATAQRVLDGDRWWRALTILIVTSPVPANPDTTVLRAVFAAYARVDGLPRARKIIQFDGPQPSLPPKRVLAYEEFQRQVQALATDNPDFAHTRLHAADRFLFAAHNLAAGIAQAAAPTRPLGQGQPARVPSAAPCAAVPR